MLGSASCFYLYKEKKDFSYCSVGENRVESGCYKIHVPACQNVMQNSISSHSFIFPLYLVLLKDQHLFWNQMGLFSVCKFAHGNAMISEAELDFGEF